MATVTNYDSHTWENGSFWSGPGATGAPTGGGTFSGIALVVNNDPAYVVLSVRDINTGSLYVRRKSVTWGAWVVQVGPTGDVEAAFVSAAGDTMTGDLTIGPKTYAALNLIGTSASGPIITGKIDATHMWTAYLAEGVTGDIAFYRTDASGGVVDTPLRLSKATGILTAAVGLNVPGPTTMAGNLTMSKVTPTIQLNATTDSGKNILGSKNSVAHWLMQLGDGTAADDFVVSGYNDAGALTGAMLILNRTTGLMRTGSVFSSLGYRTQAGLKRGHGHQPL